MVDRISTLLHNTKGLVTNYGEGGLQNGEQGDHAKFYPYENWAAEKV